MRTYIRTSVTLDTIIRIPYRDIHCDTALLICRSTGWCGTVNIIFKCRYRQTVTFLSGYFTLDGVDEINNLLSSAFCMSHKQPFICSIFPAFRNCYFHYLFCTCIDCCPVFLNNVITLTSVSSFRSCLHQFICFIFRNDICQFEECGLQNRIDTCRSHTGFDTNLHTIYGVELDIVVCNKCFHLSRQMFLQTFRIPCTVQKECTSVNQFLNHVVFVHIRRIVTGNKVCFVDQVCGFDRFLAETQVRHRNTAGLLGIIVKVSLCIHICIVTDDLDGVLVGTYGTVSAQTPELTVNRSFRSCNDRSTSLKRKVGYIIYDTDGEFLFFCIVIYSNDLCRCCIFGTQTVTSCEYRSCLEFCSLQGCYNVQIQRLAHSARFFCSVKYRNLLCSLRNRLNQS